MSLSSFSLPNYIYKLSNGNYDERKKWNKVTHVIWFTASSSALSFIAIGLIAEHFVQDRISIPYSSLSSLSYLILLQPLTKIFHALVVNANKTKQAIIINSSESVVKLIGFITIYFTTQKLEHVVTIYLIAALMTLLFSISFLKNSKLKFYTKFSLSEFNTILKTGGAFMISSIGVMLVFLLDRIMIGLFCTSDQVGYYVLANSLAQLMMFIHQAFAIPFKPFAAAQTQVENWKLLGSTYRLLQSWSLAVNGIVFLAINSFGFFIINYLHPAKDLDSLINIIILGLSLNCLFYTGFGQTTSLLQMLGKYRQESINTTVYLLINVGLNLILIPEFGAAGAVIATLISGLIRLSLQSSQILKATGIKAIYSNMLFYIVVLSIVGVMICFILTSLYWKVSVIILGLCMTFIHIRKWEWPWREINHNPKL